MISPSEYLPIHIPQRMPAADKLVKYEPRGASIDVEGFNRSLKFVRIQKKDNEFITKLREYEKNEYEKLQGRTSSGTLILSEGELRTIHNLETAIEGGGFGKQQSRWLAMRDHILAKTFQSIQDPNIDREKLFDFFSNTFQGLPAASLIRMYAELELTGKLSEITILHDQNVPLTIDREEISNKVQSYPQVSNEHWTPLYEKPIYIVENKRLAEGGISTIHKAWDIRFEREVVVKKLNQDLKLIDDYLNITELEAKTMGRVLHPGVPKVYDYIREGGDDFMIMEYIEGKNIVDIQNTESPLSKSDIANIVKQTASVIDYLADFQIKAGDKKIKLSIYHKDIKPANIILSPKKEKVSLVDFGLSQWGNEGKRQFSKGTMQYMAPERIEEGGNINIGRRSDVYSLAATSLSFLTGLPPFRGDDDLALAAAVQAGEHIILSNEGRRDTKIAFKNVYYRPPLISLSSSAITRLNEVINKGMAVKPEDRYETADDYAKAFNEALLMES